MDSYSVGDDVEVIQTISDVPLGAWTSRLKEVRAGTVGRVTRVYTNTLFVRFDDEFTFNLSKDYVTSTDQTATGRLPRGTGPKNVPEGMINPADPKLEWFWDELGGYAEGASWCYEYERVLEKFNLPPRPREYDINMSVGGIKLTMQVMARSQAEAKKKAEEAMEKEAHRRLGNKIAEASSEPSE